MIKKILVSEMTLTIYRILISIVIVCIVMILLFVQGFTDNVRSQSKKQEEFIASVRDYFGLKDAEENKEEFINVTPSPNILDPNNVCVVSGFNDPRVFNGVSSVHGAVDLIGSSGSFKVMAAHDGNVRITTLGTGTCIVGNTYIKYEPYNLVEVSNVEYKTQYLHMKTIYAKEGPIKQGEILGLMGNEGCSTDTHLHYAVYKSNSGVFKKEDPENGYINYKKCQ